MISRSAFAARGFRARCEVLEPFSDMFRAVTTPAEWRKRAAEYDAKAKAAAERGDQKEALVWVRSTWAAQDAAEEMERMAAEKADGPLPSAKRSSKLKGMTPGQIDRRARAIAGAAAKRSNDPFLLAIRSSRWRSMNRYARERLDISPAMLTFYRQGRYQVPAALAAQVREDLGLPATKRTWPAGVAT